jgi:rRNA maturation endonuclease Nob1
MMVYECMEKNEPYKHKCPVCGKFEFEGYDDMDMCDVCGWSNDALQVEKPDYEGGANMMSINQAKEAYRQGKHIE